MKKHGRHSQTIRIRSDAYAALTEVKQRYQKAKGKRTTYSLMLLDLINIADLILDESNRSYLVQGEVFKDRAVAWGHAIESLVKGHPTKPQVFIDMGADNAFDLDGLQSLKE